MYDRTDIEAGFKADPSGQGVLLGLAVAMGMAGVESRWSDVLSVIASVMLQQHDTAWRALADRLFAQWQEANQSYVNTGSTGGMFFGVTQGLELALAEMGYAVVNGKLEAQR